MKQNYFVLSCLYLLILVPGYSQIYNNGTVQISPSTIVYFGDEYTNSSIGTHNNNGELYLNSNFINNGTTTASSGTTFFSSSDYDTQRVMGTTGEINFYNLEVNLSFAGEKGLSVLDDFGLIVANSVALSNGDLRLVGEAQLVQTHAGTNANVLGTGKLLRDQQGISSPYGYNYWSSPVNNGGSFKLQGGLFDGSDADINSFSPQQVLFVSGAPYNGLPSVLDGGGNVTTPLSISKYWLHKYFQPSSWIAIDESSLLDPGIGFTMKGTNTILPNQNYVFKGDPNNGLYQIPVSSDESVLLGNPYPSSLDSNQFINDNLGLIDGTLYFWVDGGSNSHYLANHLGGYAIRNLVTGISPSVASSLISGLGDSNSSLSPTQYMSIGQGFFIRSTANGNIQFKNSQRIFKTESFAESVHYRSSEENSIIRIGYEDPEGFHRQIALGFMPDSLADKNYNEGYDALMLDTREDELFFIIENDPSKKYAIQGVGAYNEMEEYPLGFKVTETGSHTIMLDALENFNSQVYIKDTFLQTTHNLSEGDFMPALPPGEYYDRFRIVFAPETLTNDTYLKDMVEVFYSGNNSIMINNPNLIDLNEIQILNGLGQTLKTITKEIPNDPIIEIPFDVSEGLYFVTITSNRSKNTFKILKHKSLTQ